MDPTVDREEFLHEIQRRSGLDDPSRAEVAAGATLAVLAAALDAPDATRLASELPAFAERIRSAAGSPEPIDREALFERVAVRMGARRALAIESAEVVLQVVAASVSSELLVRMRKNLAPDVAALLTLPVETSPPERGFRPASERPARRDTLASGRMGSEHPLSESAPDRAQRHSIAREANPHGESKLSSARGLTQERLGDSLAGASAEPGPKRNLAGS